MQMDNLLRTDTGIRVLFMLVYATSIAPVLALMYLDFWTYVVLFVAYAAVVTILFAIDLLVPGIATAMGFFNPRYARIREYAASVYPMAFFLGVPIMASAVFQMGISNDSTRGLDPRLTSFSFFPFLLIVILDIVFTIIWVRRVNTMRNGR